MDATYEELERNDIKGPQEAELLTHAYAGFWFVSGLSCLIGS